MIKITSNEIERAFESAATIPVRAELASAKPGKLKRQDPNTPYEHVMDIKIVYTLEESWKNYLPPEEDIRELSNQNFHEKLVMDVLDAINPGNLSVSKGVERFKTVQKYTREAV